MRLLTFSFLKNSCIKINTCGIIKRLISGSVETKCSGELESLVEVCSSWPAHEEPDLRAAVLRDVRVLPDFITETEEKQLMGELDPYLKKMRYEFDHWDNAIEGYRETERLEWSSQNGAVVARLRAAAVEAAGAGTALLPHLHVLDLAPTGHIREHVDAVRFCGDVIAGLCLLSAAVMRLSQPQHPHRALLALLPRRALYVLRGTARYQFAHAVPRGETARYRGQDVPRQRRVSLICRSQPNDSPHP